MQSAAAKKIELTNHAPKEREDIEGHFKSEHTLMGSPVLKQNSRSPKSRRTVDQEV